MMLTIGNLINSDFKNQDKPIVSLFEHCAAMKILLCIYELQSPEDL